MDETVNAKHYAEQLATFLSEANSETDYVARVDGLMLLLYSIAMARTSQDSGAARQLLHQAIDSFSKAVIAPDQAAHRVLRAGVAA